MKLSAQENNTQFSVNDEVEPRHKTLVIGNISRWNAEGRDLDVSEDVQFSDLGLLTRPVLDALSPTVVLSPLMGDDFDVIDVAEQLVSFGYAGRYRAITEDVPNAAMIRREVRAHAPGLDFDILVMPPAANDS